MKKYISLILLASLFLSACVSYSVSPENAYQGGNGKYELINDAEVIYQTYNSTVYRIEDNVMGHYCYVFQGLDSGGLQCFKL